MLFKVTCRCVVCGTRWIYRTKHPDRPDPPCPNLDCGVQGAPIGMDLTSNRAPASIGGNIHNKAIDETANIVMQDFGMTDMRSDVREGETAAPKLAPALQRQADNFFGGGTSGGRRRSGSGMPINLAAHARAALSGGLRDPRTEANTIGAAHRDRVRPNVEIIAQERGPV